MSPRKDQNKNLNLLDILDVLTCGERKVQQTPLVSLSPKSPKSAESDDKLKTSNITPQPRICMRARCRNVTEKKIKLSGEFVGYKKLCELHNDFEKK